MLEFTMNHGPERTDQKSFTACSVKHSYETRTPVNKYTLLPLIQSPIVEEPDGDVHFQQRHESNTLELFFDLIFIANLSTFTSNHAVIDKDTLSAYVGLFGLLWFTWFQITLHDVRFGIDSAFQRFCKTIQVILFVGFAFVGSSFNPGGRGHNNVTFQFLCSILSISRMLLAIQYALVVYFVRAKPRMRFLTLPFGLVIGTFITCAGIFAAMILAFKPSFGNGLRIYYVWYIIVLVEAGMVLTSSSIWEELSFSHTHLLERMGLLTLIVIGEGAIGVTKTVGKLMYTTGPNSESIALIICIVLILMFLWTLYFDNHPHYHYGTIKQQVWAAVHFLLHLSIIGVVEGSQQIAVGRYLFRGMTKFENTLHNFCIVQHLEGANLTNAILGALDTLKLDDMDDPEEPTTKSILDSLYSLTNNTGLCSPDNTDKLEAFNSLPTNFMQFMREVFGGIFVSSGVKLPKGIDASDQASSAFTTIYVYYWISVAMVFLSFGVLLWLTRHEEHRPGPFDTVALIGRGFAAVLGVVALPIAASYQVLYLVMRSPFILPCVVGILASVICCDRIGREISQKVVEKEEKLKAAMGQEAAIRQDDLSEIYSQFRVQSRSGSVGSEAASEKSSQYSVGRRSILSFC